VWGGPENTKKKVRWCPLRRGRVARKEVWRSGEVRREWSAVLNVNTAVPEERWKIMN
jgi:hypothetical protein